MGVWGLGRELEAGFGGLGKELGAGSAGWVAAPLLLNSHSCPLCPAWKSLLAPPWVAAPWVYSLGSSLQVNAQFPLLPLYTWVAARCRLLLNSHSCPWSKSLLAPPWAAPWVAAQFQLLLALPCVEILVSTSLGWDQSYRKCQAENHFCR